MKSIKIETPISMEKSNEVKIEEIPLPPQELWAELDNSGATNILPADLVGSATTRPLPARIERLAFVGNAHERTIPLKFPFAWQGRQIASIHLRRLTVGEVGDLIENLPPSFDNYDIYAAMAGLPASVLRGLIDDDGEEVTGVAYDFLPRMFRSVAPVPESQTAASAST